MLRLLFEAEGFTVSEAENGNRALDRYREQPADVVVLDVLMPDMEGIETIRELKHIDAGVNVIALSGGGRMSGEYYLKMIKGFAPRYTFTKPVDPETLVEAVREILAQE
jgi:DNA-binding response OmpR family regulator